jgi:histidinol-phosphate aminotransferase
MNDPVLSLVRPEILALTPYSSARKEASGGRVWLDANENPTTPSSGTALLNRYPDPQPPVLIAKLAQLYGVPADRVLATRGSDEGIDLLLRAFCRAGVDSILTTPPTYGMYSVSAAIQGAGIVSVPLVRERDFALDAPAVAAAVERGGGSVKLVFLCSPNNPTGQALDRGAVREVLLAVRDRAVVVVDEAYAEFTGLPTWASEIDAFPHLVVLRTLSKAYGLAGARVGVTLASPAIIGILRKIIAPYPVPVPVLNAALAALADDALAAGRASAKQLVAERRRLAAAFQTIGVVQRVWPSDANFLLIKVPDASRAMSAARGAGVIWRDRSKDVPGTIRITVGTPAENDETIGILKSL